MRERAPASSYDALQAYLDAPMILNVRNPLDYWKILLDSPTEGPLARMAIDFLSVPGMCYVLRGPANC